MAGDLRFSESMNIRLLCLLGFLCGFAALHSQSYVSPQRATAGINLAVEIKDQKDLEHIKNNLQKFYGVQKVRVNGTANISQVAAVLELLDDLQDVQLLNFGGELTENDLLKLEWVDNVTLSLKNGKEDQILMNENLGLLNGLTLIFEVVPEDYYFLDALGKLKSLTLIAPFVAKEVKVAVQQVAKLKNLRNFGISTDKIGDIPLEITGIKNLKSLTVIDNLSWLSERYLDNIPLLHKNIEYLRDGGVHYLDFYYRASEAELFPWDINHLNLLFPNARFAPILYNNGDSSAISSFADFVPLKMPKNLAYEAYSKDKPLLGDFPGMAKEFLGSSEQNRIFYPDKNVAILVPAMCMALPNDSTYRGDYLMRCKWLNSPSRLFAQGQGAEYDSAGHRWQLSPAAMFEIAASAANTRLKLKDGYFIKIMFLDKPDSTGHFYAWNMSKNKWLNYYDYDYDFDDSKIVPIQFYNFYGTGKTASESAAVDQSDMNYRFENKGYFYLLEPNNLKVILESYQGYFVAPVADRAPQVASYTLRRGKSLIGLKKEYVDKKTEDGIVKFQVFDKTALLFPELKAFENYVFEIRSDMNPRDFSAQFIRGNIYSGVRIEQVGSGFVMDLRTEEGYWRLDIQTPAEKYKLSPGKAKLHQNEFLRRYRKYKTIRDQKEAAFANWQLKKAVNAGTLAHNSLFVPSQKPKGTVVREMKLRSLGVFAWATPVVQPDTFDLIVKFTDEAGIPLMVTRAYVAHAGPFSYQTFGAADEFHCLVNPVKLAYFACQDKRGRVFVLNAQDFRKGGVKNHSYVYLIMKELPASVKNLKDLEAMLVPQTR